MLYDKHIHKRIIVEKSKITHLVVKTINRNIEIVSQQISISKFQFCIKD